MSTTTAADLLERADLLSRALRASEEPVTPEQWAAFDATVHRLLVELLGHHASRIDRSVPAAPALRALVDSYPRPMIGALPTTMLTPAEIARIQESERRRMARPFRGSNLALVSDDAPAAAPTRDHVDLPGPTDPHPLAKITCALGRQSPESVET